MRTFYWRGKSRPMTPARRNPTVSVSLDLYVKFNAVANRLDTTLMGAMEYLLSDLPEVRT
jgi:hypothetical protein